MTFAAIEDLIADRMGQYAFDPAAMGDRLAQALTLYRLAGNLDRDYLSKRIRQETLDAFGLDDLERA